MPPPTETIRPSTKRTSSGSSVTREGTSTGLRAGFKSRVLRSVGSERGRLIGGSQTRLSLVKRRQSACRSPWLRAVRAARVAAAVGRAHKARATQRRTIRHRRTPRHFETSSSSDQQRSLRDLRRALTGSHGGKGCDRKQKRASGRRERGDRRPVGHEPPCAAPVMSPFPWLQYGSPPRAAPLPPRRGAARRQ